MELLGEEFVEEINLRCEDELSGLQFKIGEDERDFYWFIDSRVPLYLETTDFQGWRETPSVVKTLTTLETQTTYSFL